MKFPNLFNYSVNKAGSIADFHSGTGWKIIIRRNLDDRELEDLCHLLQQIESVSIDQRKVDTLSWIISWNKTYSVKSCYSMIIKKSNHRDANRPWKMILKTKAPVKVACIGWIAIWEACLIRDNLQKRGFRLCNRCYLFEEEQESLTHLLLRCKVYRQCWNLFFGICGISWVMPQTVRGLIEAWQSQYLHNLYLWCNYGNLANQNQCIDFLEMLGGRG